MSIRGDFSPAISGGTATMQAFDVNGLLLGSVTVPDTAGPTLSLSVAGIHSLRITETSGTIAFDDLSFGDLAAIPEPEPSALLGLGIGLLVTFRRRRRL